MTRDGNNHPPAMFDDADEHTVMVPTFSEGSFFADRYRIDRLIGSGAMGRVYAATELHSGRKVALKVLHKERLGEAETVARFKREAEVLASIGHPCIVEVFTFHHAADGTPYLAMELLEGVTLKTRLHNAGRFEDPRDFQEVLDGVAGALDAAHARGVVHRDMKPDNVFLLATGEPRAKLVDFGLSRIAKADKSLTHSGMILGTPRYMAPEQIRDAANAGPSVDIYSLGVILYESLTGQSPYPAQDYGQLLGCVMEARTTPITDVRPELAHIAPVVARALYPDPKQRFQSCGELADAYGAAIGSPSRREAIAAIPRADRQPRQRRTSAASIPVNKGSTLAFDVNALGVQLPDYPASPPATAPTPPPAPPPAEAPLAPPPPVWESEPSAKVQVQADASWSEDTAHLPVEGAEPLADPFGSVETTEPMKSGPMKSGPGGAAPPPQPRAQRGDTVLLGNAGSLPLPAAPTPPSAAGAQVAWGAAPSRPTPTPSAAASFSSSAGAAPVKPKRKGCGVALFLVAVVVVIVVSAAGGLALRAYTRGELDLTFLTGDS